jgi:hypothetical protein
VIHHIVLFKLRDQSPENLREQRDVYYKALSEVESIHELVVEVRSREAKTSYDIIQDSTFLTADDLQSYLDDDRHHAAGRVLVEASEAVASCDYEI